MNKLLKLTVFTGLMLSFTTQAADIVQLHNGDKISGKISKMGAKSVTIFTKYAKDITINWEDISNLETDSDVIILKSDKTRVKGKIDSVRDGDISVGGSIVNLTDVTKLNPVAEGEYIGDGALNIGGFLSRGNTEKGSLHVDTEYVYGNGVNRFTLGGNYDVTHDDGKESSNNLRLYGEYNRFLDDKWYVYAGADYSKDRFQDLDYRITGGAGLGYQFWDDSEKFLSFEAGPGYTYEVYSGDSERKSNYVNGRWALDFHYWVLEDTLQFFHNHEGIAGLQKTNVGDRDDDHTILIRSHTGVKVPVYGNFHVLAQFDYDWNRYPATGKEHEDFRYILGAGYAW